MYPTYRHVKMGVSGFTISTETNEMSSQEVACESKDTLPIVKFDEREDEIRKKHLHDDREEGEIVDDYEFIISSDEELCMRQRIEELEAKNAELERIAHITDVYVNEYSYSGKHGAQVPSNERYPLASINVLNSMDCQRAAQIPTDASSISSVEFPTPKKRRRRLSKVSKRDQRNLHRSDYRKHKHSSKRMNRTRYQKDIEPIQLDSYDSSDGNFSANDSSTCYLSREELRFALARSSNMDKNAASLKDRLIKKIVNLKKKNEFETDTSTFQSSEPIVVEDDNSDDSDSLEEQELRLIALKSAVMKKHMARKKRDAEVAYSPTDFDDMLRGSAQVVDVDLEELENDTRNSMEISPVASPKLHLTPDNAENSRMSMASDIIETTEAVNTKPVDMDIANSESEDELQSYYYENKKWMPIDEIPLPSMSGSSIGISQNMLQTPYDGIFYPTPTHYTSFYTKTNLEPPPLPPGVFDFDELPPPPPPFHLHSIPNEVFDLNTIKIEKNGEDANIRELDIQKFSEANSGSASIDIDNRDNLEKKEKFLLSPNIDTTIENGEDDDEEEEEALRALLLSKFNSPKACKLKRNISKHVSSPFTSDLSQEAEDPETLRSLLLSSISNRKLCQNPTESILKEAVRRLKLKTFSINSLKKTEVKNNFIRESKSHSPVVMETHFNYRNEFDHEKIQSIQLSQKDFSTASNYAQSNSKKLDKDYALIEEGFEKSEEVHKINKTIHEINHLKMSLEQPANIQIFERQIDEKKFESENATEVLKNNTKTVIQFLEEIECLKTINQMQSNVETSNVCESSNSQDNESVVTPVELVQSAENQPKPHVEITTLLVKQAVQKNSSDTPISSPFNKENMADMCSIFDSEISNNKSEKLTLNKTNTTNVPLLNFPERKVPLRSNKIIKPNKVINTQSIIKRKSVETMPFLSKKLKSSSSPASPIPSSEAITNNSSRLVTNADISTLQVKKLIITLRASDSETSEDDMLSCVSNVNKTMNDTRFESYSAIPCTGNNYFDNASPISLPMNSPGDTPKRANSPNGETSISNGLKALSECFEKKLDTFLKSVRSKVKHTATDVMELKEKSPTAEDLKTLSTPLAVRHLPQASQQEYRRLVHRMQLLEKQKKAKKIDNGEILTSISHQEQISLKDTLPNISCTKARIVSTLSGSSVDISNKTLVKSVLLKNANSTITTSEALSSWQTKKSNMQHTSKSNVLRSYESSFLKTGAGIVTNLDKSLKLVEEAKQAKITKLRCEKRMNELRSEMEELQQKLRQGQLKMNKVYPEICASNDVITTLKQRRIKLFKAATNLGKIIKGDEYRLNNDLKQLIFVKSKKLAADIKLVNSMQLSDTEKLIRTDKTEIKDESEKLDVNAPEQNPDKELSPNKVTLTTKDVVVSASKMETEKTENENSHSIYTAVLKQPCSHGADQKLPIRNASSDSDFTKELTINGSPHSEQTCIKECVESNDKINFCENEDNKPCLEKIENLEHMMEIAKENNEAMSKKPTLEVSEDDDGVSLQSQRVREYISPLAHFKTEERQLDPNGIICPYDLMGQCVDNDCNFVHLGVKPSGNV